MQAMAREREREKEKVNNCFLPFFVPFSQEIGQIWEPQFLKQTFLWCLRF